MTPSWRARAVDGAVRTFVRRRDWGAPEALARRARLIFGAPVPYQWLVARGLKVDRVREGLVRGEWIVPHRPSPGVVLYVHGGGFVSCSPATHRPITCALARRTGRRVFAVDYRLAPEHRCPAAPDDVMAAYRWLLDSGIAADSIAVAGDSAGGNLALGLAVRARDAGLPAPACIVCLSPWTDLAGTGASVRANDGRCAMFRPENMAQFAAAYLDGRAATDPVASPLYAPLHALPPVLLQVGSTELLLDDARRVHEAITRTGGESRLEVYDGMFHDWQMLAGLLPEADAALRQAADFMQRNAGG
jgi:acetyl esterase/lipase